MATNQKFETLNFVTPVGRLVSGSLHTTYDKGYNGAVRAVPQYFFALAIRKDDPEITPLLQQIMAHAWTSYQTAPGGQAALAKIQSGPIGVQLPAGIQAPFAWKIEDGDAPDNVGRPGWAGCWILKFATTLPIPVSDAHNSQMNPASVKLGWYAQVAGGAVINGNTDHTAGIFLNPRRVRVVGYGEEITPGPSAEALFGTAPVRLPPGASQTPVAPSAPMPGAPAAPAAPPMGVAPYGQPAAPAPAQAYQQPQTYAPPVPAPAPLPPAYAPPQPQAPAPVDAATWAAQHGVQHYPGYRFNATTRTYDPDPSPPVPAAAPPMGAPNTGTFQPHLGTSPSGAGQPGTVYPPAGPATGAYPSSVGNPPPPAYAPAVPAGATSAPAMPTAPAGYPGTAYPSNAPQAPVGVQPHPAFLTPGAGQ